jgi:hypothetical protein
VIFFAGALVQVSGGGRYHSWFPGLSSCDTRGGSWLALQSLSPSSGAPPVVTGVTLTSN